MAEEKKEKEVNAKNEEILDEEVDFKEEDPKKPEEKEAKGKKGNKEQSKKDKFDNLKKENESLKLEIAHWKNEYLKAHADSQNFQKRINDEAIRNRKYASQNVVSELINPIDMLVQIVNMDVTNPEVANYQIGFKMITNQIVDILKNEGLSQIDAKEGGEFNPAYMQAVETESREDMDDNHICKVMQVGYMYKDRVLRPAMVVVNKKEVKNEKGDEE